MPSPPRSAATTASRPDDGDRVHTTAPMRVSPCLRRRRTDRQPSARYREVLNIRHAQSGTSEAFGHRRSPAKDGAFMEPSGRNRWQPVANGTPPKTAQTSRSATGDGKEGVDGS